MNGELHIRLEGVESYQAQLEQLSPKQQRRLWREALRGAAQTTIEKGAKANLRAIGAGRMARGLTTRASVSNYNAEARVAARKGTLLGRMGHLLEHGAAPHVIRVRPANKPRKGHKTARVLTRAGIFFGRAVDHPGARPNPWLLPALEDNAQPMMDDVAKRVIENVERAKTYKAV